MRRFSIVIPLLVTISLTSLASSLTPLATAAEPELGPHLKALREVGMEGQGHRDAIRAWKQLSQAEVTQLTTILGGMKGGGKLADNWFRSVVETIAQRQLAADGALPVADLETFLADTSQSPRARRLAYELIAGVDPTAEQRLIAPLIDDPSLELRRDAIDLALKTAAARLEAGEKAEAAQEYRRVFRASRDIDQIKEVAAKLRKLDQPVDLPSHLGFVLRWHLIGPFDNVDGVGFEKVYPPENYSPENGVDLAAKLDGKLGPVRWQEYATADDFGIVDLNEAFQRPKAQAGSGYELTPEHKGAVAYAYAEFDAAADRSAEFRIGCINANKLWVNGKLLTANHVYHSGMEIDQYVATAQLIKGRNTILVKIAQNEQEDSWAQRWQFQLRICDQLGTAILSQERAAAREVKAGLRR